MASKSYTLLEYLVTIETELKKLKKIVAESVGADYSELIANIDGIRNELNTFKTSITDTVNTNNSEITSKFNSLEQQFITFKTSITNTVNSNNSTLTSQLSTLTTQFSQLKTTLESQVSGLTTRMTNVESRVTTLENSGGSSGGSVDLTEVNSRISTNENNISTLQTDVSSLKGRVSSLENNQGSTGGSSGGSDGYGEKLIGHYTHEANPEFQFTSFDYTTCEGTTNKPHGLSSEVEVIVVPNEWSLGARKKGVLSVPIEWVTYKGKIKLVPVDDITLKVTKSDGTSIIPVDIGKSDNENVDYSKFHFEEVTPWSISNLPTLTNYVRIIIKGYVKTETYRYLEWKIKNELNTEVSQNYLNMLGCPLPTNSTTPPYNCVYGIQNMIIDFRDEGFVFSYNNFYEGRRNGFSNLVWDIAKENNVIAMEKNGTITGGLSYLGNFSKQYSYNSNGTHVYIYDLGGTL